MAGFVCIYYGNTGSSWLMDSLGASPQVLLPGYEPLEGWSWDVAPDAKLEWLRNALKPPAEREGPIYDAWVEKLHDSPQVKDLPNKPDFVHVGFKMNNLAVRAPGGVASALADAGAKAIILTRENRIKHALSLYRYHEEKKSQFSGGEGLDPTTVNLRLFRKWVGQSVSFHKHVMRVRDALVDRIGEDNIFDVAYEDFVTEEGKEDTIEKLGAFLDIEVAAKKFSVYKKATPDDLRSAVRNYNRLRLRYVFSPLRQYFRE